MKSVQGEMPRKDQCVEEQRLLTSNKRHGAGDLFFSARIGRTKNPAAPRNRKRVPASPFPGGCNKFSLDVGVRRRRSARPSKEHEFCAAYSLPTRRAASLSRESRSKRPESAQYGSSGRKFPRREVAVERQRVSGSLESSGNGPDELSSLDGRASHGAETNDNAL